MILSVSAINPNYNSLSQNNRDFFKSFYYKATKEIQQNTILNRATIELLGADLPTAATELVGRNWKSAVESFTRITMYLVTSFFVPLLFIPVLNKLATTKFNLPKNFQKLFHNQFEDLIPEKNSPGENVKFVKKIEELEGESKAKEYFGDETSKTYNEQVSEFKTKLLKAKSHVMKQDTLYAGLLTYTVPWIQVWLSKKFLGVVGFTGEDTYLNESQKEESVQFHEKTKYFKFGLGLLPTIFGSNWYSSKVTKAASSLDSEIKESKFLSFIKKHIKQFDYYKSIYSNKLNLAGTFLFGGDAGFILTSRSLNEFIERCLRLAVFWPTMFYGVEWVNSKLAAKSDKKFGTSLIDNSEPREFGIPKVKTLNKLEKELAIAQKNNNQLEIERILKSVKSQARQYWSSILLDSLLMGVGLTSANIIGTKIRVEKGIY